MSSCFKSESGTEIRHQSVRKPHVIIIASGTGGQRRPAIATIDYKTDEDVVSRNIAHLVGADIYPTEKEGRFSEYRTASSVYEETYLVWTVEKQPKKTHQGKFYVSTEENPSYDVVFGTTSAAILESSTKKRWWLGLRREESSW
ncbi:unnamed protein product [Periconia digitata]|uniref:Uncharacterized protein n=1 Tax=Periconia digitata TaxID=1303443 RepID=A0A9W4UCC8_9PLEO|nr:unnamed protein product [Periconia digitata]